MNRIKPNELDEKKKERVRNMALALLLEGRPSFKDIISAYNKEN